jgi:hypothetical protein
MAEFKPVLINRFLGNRRPFSNFRKFRRRLIISYFRLYNRFIFGFIFLDGKVAVFLLFLLKRFKSGQFNSGILNFRGELFCGILWLGYRRRNASA